ncbi:MAG: FkbM family methyltransferase [Flavobacteriales bacterium]|nr:FkbM family methyltransferase [Flavobacteriales bacterium]
MFQHIRRTIQQELLARRSGTDAAERKAFARTLHRLDAAMRGDAKQEVVTVPIMDRPMQGFSAGTLYYLFREVFLEHGYRFSCERPDPVVIDLGANIGFATLYFKLHHPRAIIHAYEANPHVARLLRANVAANHLADVTVHEEAVSDRDGTLTFHISDDPGTLMGSVDPARGGGSALTVKAVRLSTLLGKLDRIDAVKMDIEGGEWAVLDDLLNSGQFARPKRYLIEYHHQIGSEAPRLSAFLKPFEEAGYRYQVAARTRGITDFQDLLIHAQRD